MTFSKKHAAFVDQYLKCFNATQAYLRVYPKSSYNSARANAARLIADDSVKEVIADRLAEIHMGSDEALAMLTDITRRSDVGFFFKIAEQWMYDPLPTSEILDEKEVVDETKTPPKKRTMYLVRRVVLDTDKLVDPSYSRLIHEFSDSPRSGLRIKTYDRHAAVRDVLKVTGKFREQVDITSGGKPIEPKVDDERFDRAISTLADALRESLSGKGSEPNGEVGPTE